MVRVLLAGAGVLVAMSVSIGAGGTSAASEDRRMKTARFLDATAEDPRGPDITSVVVSNTARGLLTFRVVVPNRPTFTDDMRVAVWIDADSNKRTGLSAIGPVPGADYYLDWAEVCVRERPFSAAARRSAGRWSRGRSRPPTRKARRSRSMSASSARRGGSGSPPGRTRTSTAPRTPSTIRR